MMEGEGKSKQSNIYSALPFSYLAGQSPDQKKPPVSVVKAATSVEDISQAGISHEPAGPYYGGDVHMRNSGGSASPRPESLDISPDPSTDFPRGVVYKGGGGGGPLSAAEDGRIGYHSGSLQHMRDASHMTSQHDGDNVFFRSSDHEDSSRQVAPPGRSAEQARGRLYGDGERTSGNASELYEINSGIAAASPASQNKGFANPQMDRMIEDENRSRTSDQDSGSGAAGESRAKLPRLRIADDGIHQYYKGSAQDPGKGNNFNPIWDKYYQNGQGQQPDGGHLGGAHSNPSTSFPLDANTADGTLYQNSPGSPHGVRPLTKEEDYNTLLRSSGSSDMYGTRGGGGRGCCASTKAKVAVAVVLTAIICLGAGFAGGWFIYQIVQQPSTVTSTTTNPNAAGHGAAVQTTVGPPPAGSPALSLTTKGAPPIATTTTAGLSVSDQTLAANAPTAATGKR